MPKAVYLAGPITDLSYGSANNWRDEATAEAIGLGYDVYSPMRGKDDLQDEGAIDATAYLDVYARDVHDIEASDVILINMLGPKPPMIGTMVELGYALHAGKFIILVIEPWQQLASPFAGSRGYHPFLQAVFHSGAIVPSLAAAYKVMEFLNPTTAGTVNKATNLLPPGMTWEEIVEQNEIADDDFADDLDSETAPYMDKTNSRDLAFWEDFARNA